MDRILALLQPRLDSLILLAPRLIAAVLVLGITYALARALEHALERLPVSASRSRGQLRLVKRVTRWTLGALGLVFALQILGLTAVATSLLATGGLLAIIVGFAFREIGENLLAGVLLGFSRSFELGDVIESSGYKGLVRSIELRHVHVRSDDGRDIYIPSAEIFKNPLVNFTRDRLLRTDFVIGIDYGSSVEEARALLKRSLAAVEGVLADPPLAVRVSAFTPQYVELQALFWVGTGAGSPPLLEVRSTAMAQCLDALRRAGFRLSAEVSSAVDLGRVEVALSGRPGSDEG